MKTGHRLWFWYLPFTFLLIWLSKPAWKKNKLAPKGISPQATDTHVIKWIVLCTPVSGINEHNVAAEMLQTLLWWRKSPLMWPEIPVKYRFLIFSLSPDSFTEPVRAARCSPLFLLCTDGGTCTFRGQHTVKVDLVQLYIHTSATQTLDCIDLKKKNKKPEALFNEHRYFLSVLIYVCFFFICSFTRSPDHTYSWRDQPRRVQILHVWR